MEEQLSKLKDYDKLSLQYTATDYHVLKSDYQYRLLDRTEKSLLLENENWTDHGDQTQLSFDNLEAGNYFLEIRSRQTGGYQWSKPLEISLHSRTPWFRQKWFL